MRLKPHVNATASAVAAMLLVTVLMAAPASSAAEELVADAADRMKARVEEAELNKGDKWEIPDMQQALREAWSNTSDAVGLSVSTVMSLDASGGCGQAPIAAAGCPALISPQVGWWTGNADRRNAFLMSVLVRDNYPMVHNLGADGDETPSKRALWQCLLRTKWQALGAEKVEFYESDLNTIVVIKAGNNVFANLRGTWTQAHRDSNMEWRLMGRKQMWGGPVRYHTGWGKTAEDAYSTIKAIVKDFNITQAECRLWLSGHSRGGGAALLAAAFADGRDGRMAPCKVGGVWTFGSVKPFDSAFVNAYNEHLGSKTWNWWNQIDVVSWTLSWGVCGVGRGGRRDGSWGVEKHVVTTDAKHSRQYTSPSPSPTKHLHALQVPTLPPGLAGYPQIPRMRLGGVGYNYTCPNFVSSDTCIKLGRRTSCPKRSNGAFNHHDYEYTAALAQCAEATLGLSQQCVDALAPPYKPPTPADLKAQRKAELKAARAKAAADRAALRRAAAAQAAEAKDLVAAVEAAATEAAAAGGVEQGAFQAGGIVGQGPGRRRLF